ncbi:hypothetical protein B0H19DRAFT_1229346 [Mycena capillaripes]|nr:hypothetical protein B0H19DRAFT_1229346 [Mycena capillaripes]
MISICAATTPKFPSPYYQCAGVTVRMMKIIGLSPPALVTINDLSNILLLLVSHTVLHSECTGKRLKLQFQVPRVYLFSDLPERSEGEARAKRGRSEGEARANLVHRQRDLLRELSMSGEAADTSADETKKTNGKGKEKDSAVITHLSPSLFHAFISQSSVPGEDLEMEGLANTNSTRTDYLLKSFANTPRGQQLQDWTYQDRDLCQIQRSPVLSPASSADLTLRSGNPLSRYKSVQQNNPLYVPDSPVIKE